jgi:Recombinase zinc beta ribbon domain/Recombinase
MTFTRPDSSAPSRGFGFPFPALSAEHGEGLGFLPSSHTRAGQFSRGTGWSNGGSNPSPRPRLALRKVLKNRRIWRRQTTSSHQEFRRRRRSAHQTVKAFRDQGLRFPSRLRAPAVGVVFHPLTASAAMRTLRNPRYAGAYAYGQRAYRRTLDGKKTHGKRAVAEWLACIPNAHPGYVTWDRSQENLRLLASNGHGYDVARASPPREGVALLQGRSICGRCGQYLRVRYREARGRLESWYVCDRASDARAQPNCQSLAGPPIDDAVGLLVAEKMSPAAVELALENPEGDRSSVRRSGSTSLSRDRESSGRRRPRTAALHDGRPR